MNPSETRVARLVLVDVAGRLLGALSPIAVETPWWMDVGPVVRALRARDGLEVTILRLLAADRAAPHGGLVTYLAQADGPMPDALLQPWDGALPDHPLRHSYARVGGPHADLAWAKAVLEGQGLATEAPAAQVRTWNLSSLWRLPTSRGRPAWLKVVPPFFAHEGDVLALLADAPAPRLLGRDGGRMLLDHVEGDDLYGADLSQCLAMIDLLVGLQWRWLGRAEDLLRLGLPDWRGPAMTRALGALFERRRAELTAGQCRVLGRFIERLPARFDAIAVCGLAEGLVHGDFHGGNFRGRGGSLVLLDWGDSGVGHPLLDQSAFLARMPAEGVDVARAHWSDAWQRVVPGADVERAASLLAPIAAARQALIYQRFLDHIEDAEHPYHRTDVVDWLKRTADRLRADGSV